MKMKSNMKKFLALFLSLSLVLAMFGDFAQVKAADSYTDVTLTGLNGGLSTVNDSNWVLHFTTTGYSGDSWESKYTGFTYEYDGDEYTTSYVDSDTDKLYCTIPVSDVPAGAVITIKAGEYPLTTSADTGINIVNDFQVVFVEDGPVHTKVIDPATVEIREGDATHIDISLKDANGNAISTGTEDTTWGYFLNPATRTGLRVDKASGKWSTIYTGVFVDGTPVDYEQACFKNYGAGLFYINGFNANAGTELIVKGFFTSASPSDWDSFNGNFFLKEIKFTFDGTNWSYVEGPIYTEYTGTPVLSAQNESYGTVSGFYFTSEDGAPYAEDWSLWYQPQAGDANGVFVGNTKYEIRLQKVNTNLWYANLTTDSNLTLAYGDVVTIKGAFETSSGEVVTFNEAKFQFNGKQFSEGTFTATDFTITGLAYSDIVYDTANSRWNMYFTLSTNIPGDADGTYYPYMTYDINGTEYTTHWFKSSSAHTVNGEKIYNLYVPITKLPETLEDEYVITIKAGASQGRQSGSNVARVDGINLTEDYQFTVGGDCEASAPAIDYTIGNGGDANGIYLSSNDAFPTIGWDYNLTKVGENDGIFVNGEATEVFIKKYEDGQYYVCLSDLDVVAQEGTIVMLKGAFTTARLNTVTFKTAKYIFTGGQWKTYTATVKIDSTDIWGDATGDGKLYSSDLVRVKRYLMKEAEEIGLYDADLNASGNIDEYDVNMVRRLLIDETYFRDGYNVKGVPTYEGDEEMRLTAYVAPEYNASTIAQALQDYADAGFTTILGEERVKYGEDNFDAYMQAAKEAGLDVLVQDVAIQLMGQGHEDHTYDVNVINRNFDALLKYENFRGLYMGDEPRISQLSTYSKVLTALNSLNAEHGKDLFVSHLPTYTDEPLLWDDSSLSLDEKYTMYAQKYGELFGEFVYDFYPFRHSYKEILGYKYDEKDYMRDGWFNNLTLAAKTAKGKYDAGITVQSYSEALNAKDHYRDVNEADISFQVYSSLAYGMKSISYFTYDEHWDSNVGTTNCMIYNGQKTGIYTGVKNVNTEIKKFDHVMLKFNWQGTIGIEGNNSDGIMNYVADYTSPRISSYSATNDAIIGCLKDLNGYDGFMLVNSTDPSDKKTATVSVTFNDATRAKVYIDGVENDVELTNGAYSAELAPGQGIFVIPYIAE